MLRKKILTIQDISCTGRCSITVALPVLSACGVETAVIPTSILSTHTGGFTEYYHHDLTDDMSKIGAHWKDLGIRFDAIYVGFLANASQVEETLKLISRFKTEDTVLFVDPAMADNGQMYSLLPKNFSSQMMRLCQIADVIVPNITEAYMLLGKEYKEPPYTEREAEQILRELADINHGRVILTGVELMDGHISTLGYDSFSEEYYEYACKKIDGMFYGTGDVFMSSLVGCILNSKSVEESISIASEFVLNCIENTVSEEDYRYGINFETQLPLLIRLLGKSF